jgi:hypothetical protein
MDSVERPAFDHRRGHVRVLMDVRDRDAEVHVVTHEKLQVFCVELRRDVILIDLRMVISELLTPSRRAVAARRVRR